MGASEAELRAQTPQEGEHGSTTHSPGASTWRHESVLTQTPRGAGLLPSALHLSPMRVCSSAGHSGAMAAHPLGTPCKSVGRVFPNAGMARILTPAREAILQIQVSSNA